MSIPVSQFVWQRSRQKQTALVVLLALADFADKVTGECFPGIPTLAQMARTSIRNVQITLKKLVRDGEIEIVERPGRSNLYAIKGYQEWLLEESTPQKVGVKSSAQGGEIQRTEGVQSGAEGVKSSVEGVKPDSPEPLLEPVKEPEARTGDNPPGVVVVVRQAHQQVDEKYVRVWNAALNQLESQLDRANFDTWLRGTTLVEIRTPPQPLPISQAHGEGQKTVFVIGVRNERVKDMLDGRLCRTVRRLLCDAGCIAGLKPDEIDFSAEVMPPTPPLLTQKPQPPEMPETKPGGVVKKLYEQYIGQPTASEEPCLELVAKLYPADEIEAAFVNMSLQHSGGRVRDPWAYVQGILRRRQQMTGTRVM